MELICRRNITIKSISFFPPVINATTIGFYKFLARFSGRRRLFLQRPKHQNLVLYTTFFLLLTTVCKVTDACSSRTTPKPRPPTPTPRPNITFHTYKCPQDYANWYCLNDATCFTVKIGDSLLYNCECADGYMGPRCEYKDLDGSYLPTRPRVMLETASIASGATIAFLLVVILLVIIRLRKHRQTKLESLTETHVNQTNGVDQVDGCLGGHYRSEILEKRPFGPHHYHTISMSDALRR